MRDVRFALRLLLARPGWTVAALLCLAIATGANSAAFSIVNALILRPLPFERADRLVMIALQEPDRADTRPVSLDEYRAFAQRVDGSVAILARTFLPLALSAGDGAQMVEAEFVSGNYFDTLQVTPAVGRVFHAEADRPGTPPLAVLSATLYERRFGSDPGIVGNAVRINGRSVVVAGIAPRGFVGATRLIAADLWLPAAQLAGFDGSADADRVPMFGVMGRLADGVSREQARSQLTTVASTIWRTRGDASPPSVVVHAASGFGVPPVARGMVLGGSAIVFGLMGLLMVVAAANVAALVLARASGRHQEMGIRLALGANRGRLARQILTESGLLAIGGAVAGWIVAGWATRVLAARFSSTAFDYVTFAVDIQPDLRVLAYTTGAAATTALLVGLAPIRHAARVDLVDVLKRSASGGRGRTTSRTLRLLVVGQMAVSTALLVTSGLLVRTYEQAQDADPGIDTRDLMAASLDLGQLRLDPAGGRRLFDELRGRVAALPGVSGTSLTLAPPLSGGAVETKVWVEDAANRTTARVHTVSAEIVTSEHFALLGIPLLQGRAFAATEPDQPHVALVSETMARQLWPDRSPIGERLRTAGPTGDAIEVVGVVRDTRARSLARPAPAVFYRPFAQQYSARMTLLVRATMTPTLLDAVRRAIHATHRDLAIQNLRTLDDQRALSLAPRRQAALSLSLISLLGLLLSCLGLYGVVSYGVRERAREFGIRLALGARSRELRWMVLRQGLGMTTIGVVLGLVASLALTKMLGRVVFSVSAWDPLTIVGVVGVLGLVSVLALYLPARWATAVDPATTLRAE